MLNLKTFPILFLLVIPFSLLGQFSIPTINVNRIFYDWKDSGINCDEKINSYWYVLQEEMNDEIRKKVRLCGGSVLYVGKRNELQLYNQAISVSCDSVTSLLKLDSNFINVLPPVVEEKISYDIYRDSGLYYVDSTRLIFQARVVISNDIPADTLIYLKSLVDSIEGTGVNTFAFGTRDQIIAIAYSKYVLSVSDIKKEGPVNCIKTSYFFKENEINLSDHEYTRYDLNGRIISNKQCAPRIQFINGKLIIGNYYNKSIQSGAMKN